MATTVINPKEYGELVACAGKLRDIEKRIERLRISGVGHDYDPQDLGRLEEVVGHAEHCLHRVANVGDAYLGDPNAKHALANWRSEPSGNAVGEPIRGT